MIYLIRHGETDWNLQKRYQGQTDTELNEQGREQAAKLAQKMKHKDIDLVYVSDLLRAKEFASMVFPNKRIIELPELREMNFGIFEGLTYQEIMEKYPQEYETWFANPAAYTIINGESLLELAERVNLVWEIISREAEDQNIAVVAHGGPLKVILGKLQGKALKNIWEIEVGNGAVEVVSG